MIPLINIPIAIDQNPILSANVGIDGLSQNIIVNVDKRIQLFISRVIHDRISSFIDVISVRRPISNEISEVLGVGIVLGHIAVEPVRRGLECILIVGRTTILRTAIHAAED
ncbi:hypothetical protein D3C85_1575520 [compost metagenome]